MKALRWRPLLIRTSSTGLRGADRLVPGTFPQDERRHMAKDRDAGGGFGKILLGMVLVLVVMASGAAVYLRWGSPPVATADQPFPFEEQIVQVPLNARIDREMKTAPRSEEHTSELQS